MGRQIARRLRRKGFDVLAWNRSIGPVLKLKKQKIFASTDLSEIVSRMPKKGRIFWLMLPHAIIDDFIFSKEHLGQVLKKDDIVIDGGNSFYKDSMRRAKTLRKRRISFFDCGTSGGIWGEKNGFALMVGGPKAKWASVKPYIEALSAGKNFGLLGDSGAGHFAKMVHNGIEYGMMEAIGEGYAVLKKSSFRYDLGEVTRIYKEGTVIRSWLVDLCGNIFKMEDVEGTIGKIDATGEGEWTVKAGEEFGVDVRVIKDALKVRAESSQLKNQSKYSNKIVALLRKQFGGHQIHKK